MDNTWCFRPIPDHQNCSVCFISHYPFCPTPPAFFGDDHRRFPSDLRPPPFHRPFYDPSPHPPFPLQLPPLPPPPPPPRPPSHPTPFLLEVIGERESFPKRMRVEDLAIGAFSPFQPCNRSLSFEDERRLNLIRDHGKQDISPVQEERRQSNRDYRVDWHHVEGLGSQFCSGGIDHGFPESAFDHPNDPKSTFGHGNGHFQATKAYEGYQNEQIPILEMQERFWLHERRDFDLMELEADKRGNINPQMVGYSHASQMPRFHGSGEALGGSENFIPSAQGEFSNGSWRLASYSALNDNSLRVGSFHKQQQAQTMLSSSHILPKLHPHHHTDSFDMLPSHQHHATKKHMESNSESYERKGEVLRDSFDLWPPITDEIHKPFNVQACQAVLQLGHHTSKQAGCTPLADEVNHVIGTSLPGQGHKSQAYSPIPPPLFPIHTETSLSAPQVTSSVSATISIVSPVVTDTSAKRQLSAYGSQVLPQGVLYSEPPVQASDGFANEGSPFIRQPSLNLDERGLSFLVKHSGKERPTYVDASHLFKQPYRASRPDHIVIILRGLPGSGKSYLAKALRDIEVENGGCAPRIHAMDDYFMIEVEKKVEDNEGFKSSGSVRSKKQVTKKMIEYCYEPEMEEAYRSSMLKAFKKTLDDGIFTFVVVDDRNLRVADFALFWAIAKRSGYEVYLLEATYKDPVGCSARNIHGFKLDDIQKMAKLWEEAPPLYLHLDIQSLFGGDRLNEQSIKEVDMDGDDTTRDGEAYHLQETNDCKSTEPKLLDQFSDHGSTKLGKRWNTEEEEEEEEEEEFSLVNNELQESKWSKNLDVVVNGSKSAKGNTSALSGLMQAYGKGVKCVHWGDRDDMSGFLIGAIKKRVSSLIIGPGAGYNLNSNPLLEDDPVGDVTGKISNETKRRVNEQLCAERESFRAVFDRRRSRIIGLWDADDE